MIVPGECLTCGYPNFGRTAHAEWCADIMELNHKLNASHVQCQRDGCYKESHARNLCSAHYKQWWVRQQKKAAA